MPTILEVLTKENIVSQFDCSRLLPGINTTYYAKIDPPEEWESWKDFTYKNLTSACKTKLSERYKGESLPKFLREDIEIYNEDTLEHDFTRLALPTVNWALSQTKYRPHYGRGSRAYLLGSGKEPDWSLVTPYRTSEDGSYLNCFPGDTKLSTKWYPELFSINKVE
ncbi:hypothetical protein GGR52DRAFT_139542 [Hypoxylon sp. FL1284]|nr:hypothetical protein GGR52DRAFT_139542 [Hypoxylon sp. FL1284]